MSTKRISVTALCLAGVLAGCYRTSITVQGGSGTVPLDHDANWHHALIYGLVDLSSPHNLDEICPGGTVRVHSETSFLNGLVQAITFTLYNPQEVTIECVGAGAPAAASAVEPAVEPATAPAVEPAAEETVPPPPPDYTEPPPPPPAE